MSVPALHLRPAWALLKKHHQKIRRTRLQQLFAKDRERGQRLVAEAAGIYFDYSKNRITDETLALLLQLAQESGLRERIDAMFRGEEINTSEKRAVLHVALRAPRGARIGWRRLRDGSRELRQGGYRHRRTRQAAAGRGRRVVREVLERPDGAHRFQACPDSQGKLRNNR